MGSRSLPETSVPPSIPRQARFRSCVWVVGILAQSCAGNQESAGSSHNPAHANSSPAETDLSPSPGGTLLSEVGSITLPRSRRVIGGAVDDNGRVVAWGPSGVFLSEAAKSHKEIRVCPSTVRHPVFASITSVASQSIELEVLDSSARGIVVARSGRCRFVPLPVPRGTQIAAGVRVHDKWVVLLSTKSRKEILQFRLDSTSGTLLATSTAHKSLSDTSSWKFLSPTSIGAVVGESSGAIGWTIYDDHLRQSISSGGLLPLAQAMNLAAASDGIHGAEWLALQLVEVTHGFLQTIADLRSAKRVLVAYDERGVFSKAVVIRTPIGILASSPSKSIVLALRRTDRTELVLYSIQDRATQFHRTEVSYVSHDATARFTNLGLFRVCRGNAVRSGTRGRSRLSSLLQHWSNVDLLTHRTA